MRSQMGHRLHGVSTKKRSWCGFMRPNREIWVPLPQNQSFISDLISVELNQNLEKVPDVDILVKL